MKKAEVIKFLKDVIADNIEEIEERGYKDCIRDNGLPKSNFGYDEYDAVLVAIGKNILANAVIKFLEAKNYAD